MDSRELESALNGEGAYKVVEQGDWSIDLFTHTYDNHIVQCSEDLRFYRLEGYIRKSPTGLYDWSNARLVEVVPVRHTTVCWRDVGEVCL